MKVANLIIVSILTGLLLIYTFSFGQNIQSAFVVALALLAFFAKNEVNSQYLVIAFLVVFALGKILLYPIEIYIYPNYSGFIQNLSGFGLGLLLDLVLIYLVRNRMELSLIITRGKAPSVLEKNYADGPLLGLLVCLAAIDSIALIENTIRHLEYLGFDENFAKQFRGMTFFYDYYEYFKSSLISISIAVLYMGVVIRKRQIPSAV
ncbi:hypothetical protein [Pseudoalteromonas xiamenensis]